MRRLFLLETVPSELSVSPQDTVVALTPGAACRLDDLGVRHLIPGDFGTEDRLREIEPAFFDETCSWLNRMDDLLWERLEALRALNLRPAVLYGYHWKTLLDNFYARGLEVETLLGNHPREVYFAAEGERVSPPEKFLSFCLDPRGVRAQWAKTLCAKRSIPFRHLGESSRRETAVHSTANSLGKIRRRLLQNLWRAQGLLRTARRSSKQRLTLLFLESDYLAYLLKKSLRAGHRCLLAEDWNLSSSLPSDAAGWNRTAEALSAPDSPAWDWPGRWFGVPLSTLLGPCFRSWIVQDLRPLPASIGALAARYDTLGVDFVLTPFLIEPIHFAAVSACRPSGKTQSVLIADGDGPEEAPAWDLTQLAQTHHYFVPDEEFAAYFRGRARPAEHPTARVHIGSDRWKTYPELARKPGIYLQHWEDRWSLRWRRPPLPLPDSRPVVVCPLAKPEPDVRRLHRFDYDETWYYRFLKTWIGTLALDTRYLFVIKSFPWSQSQEDTVEKIVRGHRKKHLFVSRSPFPLWLPWADRVILDHPSTPMYETALAGVPMRLILPRGLTLRPEAMRKFESCVDWYDRLEEAAGALQRYLDGPHTGTPRFRVEQSSILETLPRLRKEAGCVS